MALVELSHIKNLFKGEQENKGDPQAFRELLVMVLARATDADAYTHPAEVDTVQAVIKDYLDEEISTADIRIAALSDLYESTPLEKCISRVTPQLSLKERQAIIRALVAVMKADEHVASSEAGYFNMVAAALKLSYADVAGLTVD